MEPPAGHLCTPGDGDTIPPTAGPALRNAGWHCKWTPLPSGPVPVPTTPLCSREKEKGNKSRKEVPHIFQISGLYLPLPLRKCSSSLALHIHRWHHLVLLSLSLLEGQQQHTKRQICKMKRSLTSLLVTLAHIQHVLLPTSLLAWMALVTQCSHDAAQTPQFPWQLGQPAANRI